MLSNKAAGLTEGRALRDVIPRLDELLADPVSYFAREEVHIPRDSVSLVWFAIPAALVGVLAWVALRQPQIAWEGWTALGHTLVVVAIIFAIMLYWAWPIRLEIILKANEVTIYHGRQMVRSPWALFATSGSAVVTPGSAAFAKVLTIPVAPSAVAQVELFEDGVAIARGSNIQTRIFRVRSGGEIQLTDWFAPHPVELGTLLLALGNMIARPENSTTANTDVAIQARDRPDAIIDACVAAKDSMPALPPVEERWQAVSIDRAGWLRVPLTRLVFPPMCFVCGRPTIDVRGRAVNPALPWFLQPLLFLYNDREKLHLQMPWCSTCFYRQRKRYWGAGLYGTVGGALFGLSFSVLCALPHLRVVLMLLLGVAGMGLGFSFGNRAPFEAKHYVKDQKIALRFENPAFAHELMEAVQKRVDT